LISYVGKRLLSVIPVLVVVAVTVFLIIDITPGDPASIMFGPDATPAQVAQLRHTMVFDRPLWTQLVDWIGGVVRGDLGYSVFLHRNVSTAIGSHLQPTLYLVIFAELLAVAIAVPRSRRCAARRHRDPSEYTRLHARDRGRPDVPRVSARHRRRRPRDRQARGPLPPTIVIRAVTRDCVIMPGVVGRRWSVDGWCADTSLVVVGPGVVLGGPRSSIGRQQP
jgi:hypothetical protein